jgi:hypothetical protein
MYKDLKIFLITLAVIFIALVVAPKVIEYFSQPKTSLILPIHFQPDTAYDRKMGEARKRERDIMIQLERENIISRIKAADSTFKVRAIMKDGDYQLANRFGSFNN